MLAQSQSLQRLNNRMRPLQMGSPHKENYRQQQRSYDSSEFNFQKPSSLMPLPKINTNLQQAQMAYKTRQPKLPQITSVASEQLLVRRPLEDRRKSMTPEKQKVKLQQFAMRTKAGCQVNRAQKINQDAAVVCPKILEQMGWRMFAVADGHGLNGHLVSNHIKITLPKHLARLIKETDTIEEAQIRAFNLTNREIWSSDTDTNLSGSTTVSILIKGDKIYSANVGDSRAIMCRFNGTWSVIPLSRDHKPDDPQEKQAIINAGGRVEQQRDYHGNPVGPFRVWLQYIQAPGLAMSRSMGDKVGAQAGVIATPELQTFDITEQDQFIIVASDGVWEYLTNEEVLQIVLPYLEKDNPEGAAEKVVSESILAWRRNSLARDDITCIVIFLQK